MMKKIIISLTIIFIIITCILGNYYLNKKALMDQGKENALNYVLEKYGFKPSVVDVRLEYVKIKKKNTNPTYTSERTGYVKVDLKYQKRVFRVYIKADEESTLGYDDYQYYNIKNDLSKLIEEEVGISSYHDELHYTELNSTDKYKDCLINTYYDGTNLFDVLNNLKLVLEYTSNVNFIGINPTFFLKEDSIALLVEYDNIDVFEATRDEKKTFNILTDSISDGIEYYETYANSILSIENLETNVIEIEKHEYDDIYFKAHDDEGYVNMIVEPLDDLSNWSNTGIQNGTILTNDYEVITKNDEIYIYVPEYILKSSRVYNDYYLAIQYDYKNDERHYDAIRLKKYSNYYVAKIKLNVLSIKFNIVGI